MSSRERVSEKEAKPSASERRRQKQSVRLIVHDATLGGTVAVFWLLLFVLHFRRFHFLPRHIAQINIFEIFLRNGVRIETTCCTRVVKV